MSKQKSDESAPFGVGGCYEVGRDGIRRQVSPGTVPHPDGDGPRDKDGRRIYDTNEVDPGKAAAPAPISPASESKEA